VGLYRWLIDKMTQWLVYEDETSATPFGDFDRLCFEIRPCDVLLVEGRTRVSDVIKNITFSPWTHAALYIGRLHEIENEADRNLIKQHYDGDPNDRLLIEALLGEGTIVSPLSKYEKDHIRICRPTGLSRQDTAKIISYSVQHLGASYDIRHLLDLARFLFPYGILPRRWRSSLFEHNVGEPTRTVCSSMIAAAFTSVHFPILPVVHRTHEGGLRLYKRNTRLYTPRDFDYSPYFEIIKYPLLGFNDLAVYRQLPWDQDGIICNDENDCYIPPPPQPVNHTKPKPVKKTKPAKKEAVPETSNEQSEPDESEKDSSDSTDTGLQAES
jgi:hypothetical protein